MMPYCQVSDPDQGRERAQQERRYCPLAVREIMPELRARPYKKTRSDEVFELNPPRTTVL